MNKLDPNQKIKKQPVFHIPLKPNEILVSRKQHFKVYMERIHKLLFNQDKIYQEGKGA